MNRLLLLKRVYSTFLLSMLCVLAFAQGKQILVSSRIVPVNL